MLLYNPQHIETLERTKKQSFFSLVNQTLELGDEIRDERSLKIHNHWHNCAAYVNCLAKISTSSS